MKENEITNGPYDEIFYAFGIPTETVRTITEIGPKVKLFEGFPKNLLANPGEVFKPDIKQALILDDLSTEASNSSDFTQMLSRGSHHLSVTIYLLEHFLFSEAKERRRQQNLFHYW